VDRLIFHTLPLVLAFWHCLFVEKPGPFESYFIPHPDRTSLDFSGTASVRLEGVVVMAEKQGLK
jgi:hypothetical protein